MEKTVERIVNADRVEDLIAVFGSFDENIKYFVEKNKRNCKEIEGTFKRDRLNFKRDRDILI